MTEETATTGGFSPLSPPSGRFWITEETLLAGTDGGYRPSFSTSVVATVFFGLSAAWLRVKMRPSEEYPLGELVLDGQPLEIRRSAASDREFSLLDIERVARALHANGSVNDRRLASVLTSVVSCAVAYRMMEPPWPLRPAGEPAAVDEDDGEDERADGSAEDDGEDDDGGRRDEEGGSFF